MRNKNRIMYWFFVFVFSTAFGFAQAPLETTPSFWERDTLTGDWNGLRSSWAEKGVELSLEYHAETMGVLSGGTRRGVVYEGLCHGTLDADLERLIGWRKLSFRISTLWTHGASPSGKLIGDDLTASYIDAYDGLRLYELWFDQVFWDDHFSLRVGNLLSDEEFSAAGYGYILMNAAFGQPAHISANTLNTGPAFWMAGLGTRLRYNPTKKWYAQAAIYDGDTFDDPGGNPAINQSGLHFHLSGQQGWLTMYEAGHLLNQEDGDTGLPGWYRVGGWLHTGAFNDHDGITQHDNNWGLYFAGDQMVWREAANDDQGLGIFYRIGGGPENRSQFKWVMDTGLNYKGLFPSRNEDVASLGFAYAKHSDDLVTDHEMAIEGTYSIQVTPWMTVQPDVQWISRPGGGTTPDAWVAGLKAIFSF